MRVQSRFRPNRETEKTAPVSGDALKTTTESWFVERGAASRRSMSEILR